MRAPRDAAPPAGLAAMMGELARLFTAGAPLPDDPELAARCRAHVAGSCRLTPAEQADIYRRQFWLRHQGALREDFPALAHVLGDDGFDAFCRAYLAAHPPASFTLRDLGRRVADFAAAHEGFPPALRDLARDVARYEQALADRFDGASPPPLDPAKVTGMPEDGWSTARIVLHPLLALLQLRYPAHALRGELREGGSPALPAPRPVRLAVFRSDADLTMRCEELEPPAFALLEALGRGVPLVAACEEVAAGFDGAAGIDGAAGVDGAEGEAPSAALGARVGAWFQQWTSWGLIVDVAPGSGAERG
ncbi:HvfC/BufC family peptide modification chaperone [Sorangium sp. So ce542]|uniref:HvfC/BufC family peptide modification chaperone n=1 Tax=Sorangium sp. So ce542 TaxID=3133316 RepID=UPI003F62D16B